MNRGGVPQHAIPLPVLLSQGGLRANGLLRQRLGATGLRPRHGQVLMHLGETGSASQQDLLERLRLDPSALVGLLNDLEGDGLVERVRDPQDRRRHIVTLSDAGKKSIELVHESLDAVQAELFGSLNARDLTVLRRVLTAVCAPDEGADCS
jgi:DNA-binding MarR family transcriptional regulator